jgi:hypothetical protein
LSWSKKNVDSPLRSFIVGSLLNFPNLHELSLTSLLEDSFVIGLIIYDNFPVTFCITEFKLAPVCLPLGVKTPDSCELNLRVVLDFGDSIDDELDEDENLCNFSSSSLTSMTTCETGLGGICLSKTQDDKTLFQFKTFNYAKSFH